MRGILEAHSSTRPVYSADCRCSVTPTALVIPGLVAVGRRLCGGRRAAPGRGDRREWLGNLLPAYRLKQSLSVTRYAFILTLFSLLLYPVTGVFAMVFADRKDLIVIKPNKRQNTMHFWRVRVASPLSGPVGNRRTEVWISTSCLVIKPVCVISTKYSAFHDSCRLWQRCPIQALYVELNRGFTVKETSPNRLERNKFNVFLR